MNVIKTKSDAFTLIELLVVLFILALLLSVLVPALQKAKRSARGVLSRFNQRQTVNGVSCYATDQDERFPESVATLGTGDRWSWREPTVLTGFQKRSPALHRSVSQYLGDYIETASTLFCPAAPTAYAYAEAAWAAGDDWDNPDPGTGPEDPLFGNYCLYWNYIGYLEGGQRPFVGPASPAGGRFSSKLLISDYFGYGHWRNELTYGSRNAFGSCQRMAGADITIGTSVACDFWSLYDPVNPVPVESLDLTLSAGYVDGHVEPFTPRDVRVLKVAMSPDGLIPYPDDIGPAGTIFIPREN